MRALNIVSSIIMVKIFYRQIRPLMCFLTDLVSHMFTLYAVFLLKHMSVAKLILKSIIFILFLLGKTFANPILHVYQKQPDFVVCCGFKF
jgi:hypothetical protein